MTGFESAASALAELGRLAWSRGLVPGTSGNFSAVVQREPLRLAITRSGADKGALRTEDMLEIDAQGSVLRGAGSPSAETAIHLAIVRARGAGAVAHTHSVWATRLSDTHAAAGELTIEGYEMVKGLSGVATHEHRERVPIVENTQDWQKAAPDIEALLRARPEAHAFLIRRHGLYTWGRDAAEVRRHLETLEFLLEAVGRDLWRS